MKPKNEVVSINQARIQKYNENTAVKLEDWYNYKRRNIGEEMKKAYIALLTDKISR